MKTIMIGFNHGDFISTWYSSYLEINDKLVCSMSLAPLLYNKFFWFSSSIGPDCIFLTTIWVLFSGKHETAFFTIQNLGKPHATLDQSLATTYA